MDDFSDLGQAAASTDRQPPRRRVATVLKVLAALAALVLLVALLLPLKRTSREAARRNSCTNHLKQIELALQNYADGYKAFPPAFTTDAEGKPLHSWRTLILPYLEENRLYQSIDLTKPWDDPVNADARATVLGQYRCPSAEKADDHTQYLAVVMPGSCLQPGEPRKLSDITDGAVNTLIVVEVDADHAVPWMSPQDADEHLLMSLGANSKLNHLGVIQAAWVDGHVSSLSDDISERQRRALISIAGNDAADVEEAN